MEAWWPTWSSELLLVAALSAWILYELYGRTALDFIASWSSYIRLAGGAALILYIWWQSPEEFKDTLELAKDMLVTQKPATSGTREKRNVTGLMKKKVAADQGWKCGHCGALLDATYEVDHKLALFQGGTNELTNLVALCPHCHRTKTVNERL